MKKIILLTDFGVNAKKGYATAVSLAKRSDEEILLVHIEPSKLSYLMSQSRKVGFTFLSQRETIDYDFNQERVKKQLLEESELPVFEGLEVRTQLLLSDDSVEKDLFRFINKEEHSCIVLGVGDKGTRHSLTVDVLVQKSTIPVITSHTTLEEFIPKQILLPTDLETIDAYFVDQVIALKQLYNAKLKFVYINTSKNFQDTRTINRKSNRLCERTGLYVKDFEMYSAHSFEDGINQCIKHYNVDLLAIPTHGRIGINHLFGHSYTEDLIHEIDIPVFTYNMHNDLVKTPQGSSNAWAGGFVG